MTSVASPVADPARGAADWRTLESFVPGAPNLLAYRAVQQASRGLASGAGILFLHGPSGNGKSHLLESLASRWRRGGGWAAPAAGAPRERGMRIGGVALADRIRWAVRAGRVPALREDLETLGWVVLDGLEGFATRPVAQRELRALLDAWRARGVPLAIAAREAPGRQAGVDEAIGSRLASGFCVRVAPPDADLCVALVCREMAPWSSRFPPRIVRGWIEQVPASAADAIARARDAARAVRGGTGTIEDAVRAAFRARLPLAERLASAIEEAAGIPLERLRARSRAPSVVVARRALHLAAASLGIPPGRTASLLGVGVAAARAALRRAARDGAAAALAGEAVRRAGLDHA